MPKRRWNGADVIKRFTFFSLCCLCIHCLIFYKIYLTWPLLIDRETKVKMLSFANSDKKKKINK